MLIYRAVRVCAKLGDYIYISDNILGDGSKSSTGIFLGVGYRPVSQEREEGAGLFIIPLSHQGAGLDP